MKNYNKAKELCLSCVIVDSDHQCQTLKRYLHEYRGVKILDNYENSRSALLNQQKLRNTDFLFIALGENPLLSLELAKRMREEVRFIIFCGTSPSHALDAFQAGGDHYLLVPVGMEKVIATIEALKARDVASNTPRVTLPNDEGHLRIPVLLHTPSLLYAEVVIEGV